MAEYWFKRKRFGFGAAPASWEGWAITVAYVAALLGLGAWLAPDSERPVAFIAIAFVLTLFYVAICWRKTEGGWRWRWGGDNSPR